MGCSPWGRKESDTTGRLPFHFSLSRIGEGNGNPLQCSCLESPMDGGAWWAAVYGITQSRTRLKRLSSSSSSRSCYPPAQNAPKWFTLKINPQPTRTLDLARAHPYILLSDPPVTLTLYYIIRTVSAPHLAPRGLRDFSFPESSPSGILVVGTPCPSFPGFLRCCLLFVF